MTELIDEIAAYERMKGNLEASHPGKFVVIKDRQVAGIFDTPEEATNTALAKRPRGPFIVQQIGTDWIIIPAEAREAYLSIKGQDDGNKGG